MLFAYTFIGSNLEKIQEYFDHIFLEIWCGQGAYSDLDVVPNDFRVLLQKIRKRAKKPVNSSGHLDATLGRIHAIFLTLDQPTKKQLAQAYIDNNKIEKLCNGDTSVTPFRYTALEAISPELSREFKALYPALYSDVLKLSAVRDVFESDIDGYYDDFVAINNKGKCPFCGISDIKSQYDSIRDAFDHYLPKDTYPFNAINLHNLAPICRNCNSGYKLQKDPLLRQNGQRRKTFYPFVVSIPPLDIRVDILNRDINHLAPDDINITILGSEETETWRDVFKIDEQYKSKCTSECDGKYWFSSCNDEWQNASIETLASGKQFQQDEWLGKKLRAARTNLYAEVNFLKIPFLEGCSRAEMFG